MGVFLFLTVAAVDVPHTASDAELVAWWQVSGNRWSGVFSGLFAIGVAASVAVVRHHLGTLARESAWMAFGRSMATAVTALWLVTGAVRAAVGHLVDVMDEPLPGVDVLRTVTAVNYVLLGLSGMAALGLMILGVSVALCARHGSAGSASAAPWWCWARRWRSTARTSRWWPSLGCCASPCGSGGVSLGDVRDRGVQRREQHGGVDRQRDAVSPAADRDGALDP